jgi:hypothetical protein
MRMFSTPDVALWEETTARTPLKRELILKKSASPRLALWEKLIES